jgi:hypothetical protein
MTTSEGALVYGWQQAAAIVGCSVRRIREVAAERGLVVDRRSDNAVALPLAALEDLAVELGRSESVGDPGEGLPSSPVPLPDPAVPGGAPVMHGAANVAPSPARGDEGQIAARIFSELEVGKPLRQIVVDQQVAPELVADMFRRWRALEVTDFERREDAEARLARMSEQLESCQNRLDDIVKDLADRQFLFGHQAEVLETRLQVVETRLRTDLSPHLAQTALRKVGALEAQLRALPHELMPVERRCGRCGQAAVVVPAGCHHCGLGFEGSPG